MSSAVHDAPSAPVYFSTSGESKEAKKSGIANPVKQNAKSEKATLQSNHEREGAEVQEHSMEVTDQVTIQVPTTSPTKEEAFIISYSPEGQRIVFQEVLGKSVIREYPHKNEDLVKDQPVILEKTPA